jgi:NADPH:quinone reductase-like Zn-dependent oxidoreductase
VALLESGAVSPPPVQRFKLSDATQAHRISEGRHFKGKLVFEIR